MEQTPKNSGSKLELAMVIFTTLFSFGMVGGMLYAMFWFIYKVCAGSYHLLDKLIDKI